MFKRKLIRYRSSRGVRLLLSIVKAFHWLRYYIRMSGSFPRNFDPEISKAWILRDAHSIEKGLSLPVARHKFGKAKISHLKDHIALSAQAGENQTSIEIGFGVLSSYVAWHQQQGSCDADIDELYKYLPATASYNGTGGLVAWREDFSDEDTKIYDSIVLTRRSVRNFKHEVIPIELLEEAIAIANYSPSVCNRQPWAAVIIQDPITIQQMLALQSGNRGFSDCIKNLIIVLANTKAFVEEYEIFEPFVDAGIFSGALVNSLNARNIGTCCLNLCTSHKKLDRIVDILSIEKYFFPIMMIACGYPVDHCQVAISKRLTPTVFIR